METKKYISCSGAGTKGLMFSGVLDALEDHMEHLGIKYSVWRQQLKGLAGTSAGSIICLFIILGLNKEKRNNIISRIFCDMRNIIPCPDISLMITSYGLENGNTFKENIKNILVESGLSGETTLGDIKRLFGKEFVCVCSDLKSQEKIYLSSSKNPNLKIYDTIYMSCSIPFLFVPMEYNGSQIVDGSLTEDIPFVFDNDETLFLVVDKCKLETKIESWADYIHCLLSFPLKFQNNHKKIENSEAIIIVENDIIRVLPPLDLNIDTKTANMLISYGYLVTLDIILKKNIKSLVGSVVELVINIMKMDDLYDSLKY